MLDARTPWKFYAPPHAAIAITLMAAPKLPQLAKVALALGGSSAGAVALVQLLGAGARTRSLAAGVAHLFMLLTGNVNPAGGPFSVLFVDGGPNQALHAHSWKYVLTPGISGAVVLLIIAFLKIQIMKAVRKAVAPAAKES